MNPTPGTRSIPTGSYAEV